MHWTSNWVWVVGKWVWAANQKEKSCGAVYNGVVGPFYKFEWKIAAKSKAKKVCAWGNEVLEESGWRCVSFFNFLSVEWMTKSLYTCRSSLHTYYRRREANTTLLLLHRPWFEVSPDVSTTRFLSLFTSNLSHHWEYSLSFF